MFAPALDAFVFPEEARVSLIAGLGWEQGRASLPRAGKAQTSEEQILHRMDGSDIAEPGE